MSYVPDPTDVTQPGGSVSAKTAAAEFRALKSYIAGLTSGGVSGMNIFRKNKVINGDMRVDQRRVGALVSIAALTVPVIDKWRAVGVAAAGVFSGQQVAATIQTWLCDKKLQFIVTTIDAAPAAGSRYGFYTGVEGIDCTDLFWGTISAKTIAISFTVESSLIGTYSGAVRNAANDRTYPFTFAITVANTPEIKTIVVPGDTAGVWTLGEDTRGLCLDFTLDAGATAKSAVPNAWQAGAFTAVTGTVAFMATIANNFSISKVQVEVGTASSSFEWLSYTDQLIHSMRYLEKSASAAVFTVNDGGSLITLDANVPNGNQYATIYYKVMKMGIPTITTYPYTTPANTSRSSNGAGADYPALSAVPSALSRGMFSVINNCGGALAVVGGLIIMGWFAEKDF